MDMEGMATGNRFILILGVLFSVLNIYSQELSCFDIEYCGLEADVIVAIEDYCKADSEIPSILLIDSYMKDSVLHIFRITSSLDIFELFYKNPDCYLSYKNKIGYLFTGSSSDKDSIWLNKILSMTIKLLDFPQIKVNWERDSITDILGYITIGPDYSPPIIEYTVYKEEIMNKTICKKMYFPNTGEPKGVKILRKQ